MQDWHNSKKVDFEIFLAKYRMSGMVPFLKFAPELRKI